MEQGSVTLVNRELGFSVDLPAPWQVRVEQRFDGPLRMFGFAMVRKIPAGADLAGFGLVPVEVYLRQWWLQGQGLCLEIQGVAPTDAPVLQETIDLIVKSLRSA